MKVVLRTDYGAVGKRGDIVEVADGYARNFLLPRGFAIKATEGVVSQAASMRRSRDLKDARDREAAETVARKLVPMVIRVSGRAGGEGKLFGSITTPDIVKAVAEQAGVELDRRKVQLEEPIRTVGTHEVPVRLHTDVQFRITLEVTKG